jgi:hypothetical protein
VYPISKAPGGRAGALPGKAGSVLFMKNLNGRFHLNVAISLAD